MVLYSEKTETKGNYLIGTATSFIHSSKANIPCLNFGPVIFMCLCCVFT